MFSVAGMLRTKLQLFSGRGMAVEEGLLDDFAFQAESGSPDDAERPALPH